MAISAWRTKVEANCLFTVMSHEHNNSVSITERYGLFNSLLKLLLRFVQQLAQAIMKGNISYVFLTLCWEYTGHRLPSQYTCYREMSSSIQHPWLHRCSHQAQNTCFFPLPYSFVKVSYSWFSVYQLFLRRTQISLNHVIFYGISKCRLFPFATRKTPREYTWQFYQCPNLAWNGPLALLLNNLW